MPFQYRVRSDKDTHFTGAIAQNASENENIALPAALAGINGNARFDIRAITLLSDQNLAWELAFYSKDTFDDADADVDTWISRWTFTAADAVQLAGAGLYRYYVDGLKIQYLDEDNSGEFHVGLVNRSAAGKNAGATGEVVIIINGEPIGAW